MLGAAWRITVVTRDDMPPELPEALARRMEAREGGDGRAVEEDTDAAAERAAAVAVRLSVHGTAREQRHKVVQ